MMVHTMRITHNAKYGTARECEIRSFVVGDIIEGTELGHTQRLKIKYIGNKVVVFGELLQNGNCTLSCRQWRKIN
jgi:hypothetical protein